MAKKDTLLTKIIKFFKKKEQNIFDFLNCTNHTRTYYNHYNGRVKRRRYAKPH